MHASGQAKKTNTKKKADTKIRREETVEVKEGDGLHHPMGGCLSTKGKCST